ncbi:VTT domain-containing protein [Clostridium sp. E02]|uniref:VTT domain-containing protein n=1 Tax=Clostridium sp. E02 TaxID=2487134 RepID=UPI000F521648|nr:VTT domain-containing protein [Clostridium sp. E02]
MKFTKKDKSITAIIFASCAFVALVIVTMLVMLPYIEKLSDPEYQNQFKGWVESIGIRGWLIVLGIQILQIVIAFIPGEPIEILAGIIYGTFGGFFVCLVGASIASTITFTLSKKFGKPLLNRFFGMEKVKVWRWIQDNKKIETVTFLLFFIPGTPKDMLTYVVGLSNIKLSKFIMLSSFARIPSMLSSAMVGSKMRKGEWEISITVFVLTGVIGLIGILCKDKLVSFCRTIGKRNDLNTKGQCMDFIQTINIEKLQPFVFCHLHFDRRIDIERLKYAVQQTLSTVPQILCSYDLKKGKWVDRGHTIEDLFVDNNSDFGDDWCWNLLTETQLKIHVCHKEIHDILTIGISHILCDGAGFTQYLYLLANYYNNNDSQKDILNQRDLKPILEKINIKTSLCKVISYGEVKELPFDKSGNIPYCLIKTIEKQEFLAIQRKTKALNCTVNDLLLTAYARTIVKFLKTESITLNCPINLRRFGKRELQEEALTIANMTGIYKLHIIIKPSECFETTLLKIHSQMEQLKFNNSCFNGIPLLHFLYNKVPIFILNIFGKKLYKIFPISFTNFGVIDCNKLVFDGTKLNKCFLTGTYRISPDFQVSVSTYQNTCTLNCNLIGSEYRKKMGLDLLEKIKIEIIQWLKN